MFYWAPILLMSSLATGPTASAATSVSRSSTASDQTSAPTTHAPGWNGAALDADRLDRFARSSLPGLYGGSMLTDQANHIDVYLTSLDPNSESNLLTGANVPVSEVTFRSAATTLQELVVVIDEIFQQDTKLLASGINLASCAVDVPTSSVDIKVVNPTDAQTQSLTSAFGPFVHIQSTGALPSLTDRQNDTSPFNGGDFTMTTWQPSNRFSADCTSGIPTHTSNGGQYMLSAGHCTLNTKVNPPNNGAGSASSGALVHNYLYRTMGSSFRTHTRVQHRSSKAWTLRYPSSRQARTYIRVAPQTRLVPLFLARLVGQRVRKFVPTVPSRASTAP